MDYDFNYVKENREALSSSIKKRFLKPPVKDPVDRIIELSESIKNLRKEVDLMRHERNVVSEGFSEKKYTPENQEKERKRIRDLMDKIKEKENEISTKQSEAENLFLWLPNVIGDDVPEGKDDNDNVEIRRYGKIEKKEFKVKDHIDLGKEKNIIDIENAAKVSGSRFVYLEGKLVQLALALEVYSISKIASKGYKPILPPFLMRKEIYSGIAHMATFEDALYKVSGVEEEGNLERFLISTTEHPLIAKYADTVLEDKELPIKLVGVSPAFRKEAGAHGKDTKGMFRVHQFNQTEQIVICKPEEAQKFHEEMIRNVEDMWKELGIPYRVVKCSAGDMGIRDVKQYDIEGYIYSQGKFREVGSFDNTTDWIARRLNIKYVDREGNKRYANTLDGTGLPIERTMIAIMDAFQQPDKRIKIPEALVKYTGFDFI